MTLNNYQIVVIDPISGDVAKILDAQIVDEMRYSRSLNDVGVLAFSVPLTDEYETLFRLDTLCEVYFSQSGSMIKDETYLIRSFERSRGHDYDSLVLGGLSLNHFLSRRIIFPDDDPLGANGFSVKLGPADQVIQAYADEQIGASASAARQLAGLTVLPTTGMGEIVGAREGFSNLLEVFQNLSTRGNVDFEISRTTGLNFELFIGQIGSNKTKTYNYPGGRFVYLTPRFGNLNEPSLLIDRRREKTFLFARSEGNRGNQTVLPISGPGGSDSPWNRIEADYQKQSSDVTNAYELLTAAQNEFDKLRYKPEFTFSPSGTDPGVTYRKDWVLGDRITVGWGNFEDDLRITGVEIKLSTDNEELSIEIQEDNPI